MMMERLATTGQQQSWEEPGGAPERGATTTCRTTRWPCNRVMVLLAVALTVVAMGVQSATPDNHRRQHHQFLNDAVRSLRHRRAAFTPPTVTSLSPPNRSSAARVPAVSHVSSSSSSNMPPVVASRAPSSTATRTLHHNQQSSSLTPGATAASGHRRHPTVADPPLSDQQRDIRIFAQAAWDHTQHEPRGAVDPTRWKGDGETGRDWLAGPLHIGSLTVTGGDIGALEGGAGLPEAGVEGSVWGHVHQPHSRPDTFGHSISEDLSHVASQRGQHVRLSLLPQRDPHPPEAHDPRFFDSQQEYQDTDYHAEDYALAHDYGNNSSHWPSSSSSNWRDPLETNQSYLPGRGGAASQRPLSIQHIVRLLNLTRHDELLVLLQRNGVPFRQLLDSVNRGASEQEVLQLLNQPGQVPPTNHPLHSPAHPKLNSLSEEDHQAAILGDSMDLPPHEASPGDPDAGRRRIKNRKKGERGRGRKNKQRKNRRRKGKKRQRVDSPEVSVSEHVEESMATPPVVLSVLPPHKETTTQQPTTGAHTTHHSLPPSTMLPLYTSPPPAPHTSAKPSSPALTGTRLEVDSDDIGPGLSPLASTWSPQRPHMGESDPSVSLWPTLQASEASIISVTFTEEEVVLPQHRRPAPRRPHQHRKDNPHPTHPRPLTPGHDGATTHFVREEVREGYVFPGRGVLVVSGLMGALAVFTLVVLVSYALVKCRKKPAVNNYQVSSQQNKPSPT